MAQSRDQVLESDFPGLPILVLLERIFAAEYGFSNSQSVHFRSNREKKKRSQ